MILYRKCPEASLIQNSDLTPMGWYCSCHQWFGVPVVWRCETCNGSGKGCWLAADEIEDSLHEPCRDCGGTGWKAEAPATLRVMGSWAVVGKPWQGYSGRSELAAVIPLSPLGEELEETPRTADEIAEYLLGEEPA